MNKRLFAAVRYYSRKFVWFGVAIVILMAPIGTSSTAVHAQNLTISSSQQDCDANAVLFCGASSVNQLMSRYTSGDGHNSAASIQHIYSFFGISAADIASMGTSTTTVIAGKVTATGNVHDASDHVIATGATTAGRQDIAGSTRHDMNGTTFFSRPPSVSFQSSSLPAFVVMNNGQFSFAIIASCGNPVTATPRVQPQPQPSPQPQPQPQPSPQPQSRPNLTVSKLVAAAGSNDFEKSVSVASGSHVTFMVLLKSTGDTTLSNLNVADQLPAQVTATSGSLQHNSQPAATGEQTSFFSSGFLMSSLPSEVTFTYDAVVGASDTAQQCAQETITNTVTASASNVTSQSSTATVNKTCASTPSTPVQSVFQQQQQQQQQQVVQIQQQVVAPTPPATPAPTPAPVTPVVATQPPAPVPVATTSAAPAPQPAPVKTLVNTGPGNTIKVFLLSTMGGIWVYRRLLIRRLGH